MTNFKRGVAAIVLAAACASVAAAPASAAPSYKQQLLVQQQSVAQPAPHSKLALAPPTTQNAAGDAQWIDGNIAYQSGTNCSILGQPYTEQQVGAFTGYWGKTDTSYPKIGDRFWGHIYLTVVGNTCPYGIADVATHIQLPAGVQLAIKTPAQSSDPQDRIQCYGYNGSGTPINLTDQQWVAPWNNTVKGKYCDSTQVTNDANGIYIGQRLLAQGQSFQIIFPLVATKKLAGIGEPNNASRLTSTLTSGVNTTAQPFQWVFVGDRPVDPNCTALGTAATSAITDTTAHSKSFLCNWYRTGKVNFEIGTGTTGAYQTTSPQMNIDGGFQGYILDQDWNGLSPGSDYHWRVHFVDTKGTPSTLDDTDYYSNPQSFHTTGTASGPPSMPTPGTGGTGNGNMPPVDTPPATGGDTSQQPPTSGGGGDTQQQPPAGGGDTTQQQPGGQTTTPQDQGGGGGTTVTPDRTAPKLTAAFGKTKLAGLLKKGLPVTATCNEGCTVQAQLQLDAKTAKKLKLGKKITVIGKGQGVTTKAGTVKVQIKLTSKAKKALKKLRSLKVKVVVVARDAVGNATAPQSKTLTLKK